MNFLCKHLHEHVTRINGVSKRNWVLDYNIFQMFRISDWFQSIYIDSKRCYYWNGLRIPTQPVFTCSKLKVKTLEQGVKYVESEQ